MGPNVHAIATKSTLDKKVMILFSKVKISKNIEQNGEAHQRPQYDPRQTRLPAAKGEQQWQKPHPHHRHHCRHRCHQYLCFLCAISGLFEWSGKTTKIKKTLWDVRLSGDASPRQWRPKTRVDKLDKMNSPFVPSFNLPPNCDVLRWPWALNIFLIFFWKHIIAPVYVVGAHSGLP